MPTLADSILEAARDTPQRVALIDGDLRLDCADSLRTGQDAGAGADVTDAGRRRAVVHVAQLA